MKLLIYWMPSYVVIYRCYTLLKNGPVFWHILYIIQFTAIFWEITEKVCIEERYLCSTAKTGLVQHCVAISAIAELLLIVCWYEAVYFVWSVNIITDSDAITQTKVTSSTMKSYSTFTQTCIHVYTFKYYKCHYIMATHAIK